MVKKIVIWGMGDDYENLLNLIMFEIYKGNIRVEALVCRRRDIFCKKRDGFIIVDKTELSSIDFEYILITSSRFIKEIKQEAIEIGVPEHKIIDAEVLKQPFFDFKLYTNLMENPATIISDDCWGGYAYNRLKLPFSSPFINIFIDNDEYAKLIQDPLFYINTELTMVREGNLREGISPIASLGDDSRQVRLKLVHDSTFEEGKERWDRRKKRINPDNIFIKMRFSISDSNKEMLINAFESAPYNKILFYNGDEEIEGAFKTDRFIWRQKNMDRVEYFHYYDYMRLAYRFDLDLLKLLNGDKNYSRYL